MKRLNLGLIVMMVLVLGVVSVERVSAFAVAENSYALCHDEIDNDGDEGYDMGDSDCEPFLYSEENTDELCHDGLDNDGDEVYDESDPDCASFYVTEEPSNRSGSRPRSGAFQTPDTTPETGQLLSATTDVNTTCPALLTSYMRYGADNNPVEVKMLQEFLNRTMDAKIPVTGFFGKLTEEAVKRFQEKYRDEIITPWVTLGLLPPETLSTGYVYKTTLYTINKMICPNNSNPTPTLP